MLPAEGPSERRPSSLGPSDEDDEPAKVFSKPNQIRSGGCSSTADNASGAEATLTVVKYEYLSTLPLPIINQQAVARPTTPLGPPTSTLRRGPQIRRPNRGRRKSSLVGARRRPPSGRSQPVGAPTGATLRLLFEQSDGWPAGRSLARAKKIINGFCGFIQIGLHRKPPPRPPRGPSEAAAGGRGSRVAGRRSSKQDPNVPNAAAERAEGPNPAGKASAPLAGPAPADNPAPAGLPVSRAATGRGAAAGVYMTRPGRARRLRLRRRHCRRRGRGRRRARWARGERGGFGPAGVLTGAGSPNELSPPAPRPLARSRAASIRAEPGRRPCISHRRSL